MHHLEPSSILSQLCIVASRPVTVDFPGKNPHCDSARVCDGTFSDEKFMEENYRMHCKQLYGSDYHGAQGIDSRKLMYC